MPMRRRMARRAARSGGGTQEQAAPAQAAPAQEATEQVPAPASSTSEDQMGKLKELGELRDQGILTDDEFDAEKKKILARL